MSMAFKCHPTAEEGDQDSSKETILWKFPKKNLA